MQLRQAQALRILDDNQRGIGHIHPHFNYGGRDQKVELAVLELFHDRCFFGRLEATMNKPHLQIWQTFRQLLRSHFRRLALQRF